MENEKSSFLWVAFRSQTFRFFSCDEIVLEAGDVINLLDVKMTLIYMTVEQVVVFCFVFFLSRLQFFTQNKMKQDFSVTCASAYLQHCCSFFSILQFFFLHLIKFTIYFVQDISIWHFLLYFFVEVKMPSKNFYCPFNFQDKEGF